MRVSFAVAPYFRSKLTTANKEDVIKATKEIQQKAQKLATELGLTITGVKPLGGTYLGSSEISWFYEIKGGTRECVDLFASLMGDLSNEYQDAVIASNYVSEESADANAIEVTLIKENAKIEDIEKHLNELGIEGSSYHFDSGELTFFVDKYKYISEEKIEKTDEEIKKEINNILKLTEENYGYKFREQNSQNSRNLGNESRQKIYRSWMSNGPQNRKLYKACEKALAICEATAPYYAKAYDDNATDEEKKQEEAERLKAAVDAANKWNEEHLKKKEAPPAPVVSTTENIVTLTQEEPSSTELSNTSDILLSGKTFFS
ncbi:MAG: hypothetical protein MJZ20_06325 [Bacteroidaceae bacterium]|nr:hypothetical protein [Bacteroidaceae bacterium]